LTNRQGAIELPFGQVPRGYLVPLEEGGRAFARLTDPLPGTPPTLLLHGLGATAALNWATCFGPLSAVSQVIAPDHRGHGRGRRVGNRFRLADCADDAAAILRATGSSPAVVVGYSMGGPIAQLLALRHPDLVAGLILCATARDFRGGPADRMRFATVGALAASARFGPSAMAPAPPVLPGSLRGVGWAMAEMRRHEPSAVLSATAALGRFTSREWIGSIDVPATVVVHGRDRVVPTRRQHKLADALPDAHVVEVELDHMGVSREEARYGEMLVDARRDLLVRITSAAPSAGTPTTTRRWIAS
jgi:pimeloyl-ACP methyl ester carboxylesterase